MRSGYFFTSFILPASLTEPTSTLVLIAMICHHQNSGHDHGNKLYPFLKAIWQCGLCVKAGFYKLRICASDIGNNEKNFTIASAPAWYLLMRQMLHRTACLLLF